MKMMLPPVWNVMSHLTQELLRKYARKRISPTCMIKVDLKKVFDTMDWEFLMAALVGFEFPQRFCAWIRECVTTASYSISLNGGIYGFFSGKCGLRQSDLLSPLLFRLCIEVLSRRMQVISSLPLFHHHPMCKEVGITHFAYADDLMLFA
ncbi:secreted RxLR effector protein 78-like [Curcuma longa]|uniref:secreted RxLR effector protein 78-like n=1 Tax=Curcuma longa TaxID=136217 RepID=UPI003D9F5E7C